MRAGDRWAAGSVAACLVGVLVWVALTGTALSSTQAGSAAGGQVAPGVPMSLQAPFSSDSPATAAQLSADAASRIRFRGFRRADAISLAKQDFRIERPAWTPPAAEGGAQLGRYLGEDAVVEKLRDGKHDVVSSTIPLRVNNGSGLAPTSLTLHEAGGAYAPANPVVPVTIAKQASGGIDFPAGVSVTPLSAASPEASTVVGDSVLYANTAKDTDLIAEPRPRGAEISWQLRSQESPQSQSLVFHLPSGARLRASASTPGGVEVVIDGEENMFVPPAVAHDADGKAVPASYSLAGDILTTHVDLGGEIAFPVFVDPEIFNPAYGFYGSRNGANVWSGWSASAPQGYFGPEQSAGWYKIGTNPGAPVGSYGALTITAPGEVGKPGSAGITRVDLTGVQHGTAGQSRLISTINESNGPAPEYSYNGSGGESGPLPLYENNNLSNQPIAFCASGAGGHDGGEQPLCDEEHYQGHIFVLEDEITSSPQTAFNWVLMEGAQVTYRDITPPNKVILNHSGYEEGEWLKTGPTNWKIEAEDEGLGVSRFELQIPAGNPPWFTDTVDSSPGVPCATQNGFTGCPSSATSEPINLSGLGTGAYSLAPIAADPAENTALLSASYVGLYVDKTAPVIGSLTGPLAQAAGGVIGDGNYALNFDPTDGTPENMKTAQSGVRTVEIQVDGRHAYTDTTTCPTPKGVPASNCFALNGTWTMNGQAYGAGPHTIAVIAKDWLGNESKYSFGVTVNEAAYEPLGPGGANVETGDYKLNPTDVSLSGGNATLSVSRTYDSRNLTQGAPGPLGPQWMLNLPGSAAEEEWQSLTPLPEGSISVYNAHGEQLIFSPKTGGGYNSPAGYQTETLTAPKSGTYQLTDSSGDYTQFTQSASGAPFTPSSVVQAGSAGELNKIKYTFTTKEGITEPTQVLGPEPSEGACTAKLVQGCRALSFEYATSTGASGEAPSEWGTYKGRLAKVFFTAWEPVKGEMAAPVAVAQYSYDKQGRLRAEWDPRISPNLKTTYGYDSEGHVTSVTPPGQQPWLLHYGTAAGDPSLGRILSVARPPVATAFSSSSAPANTAAPTLSTSTPAMGTALSVTTGTWTNTPLIYGYQWERCNASGGECAPIPGATSAAYTPVSADAQATLKARISASNADGSTGAATTLSKAISITVQIPRYSTTFGSFETQGYGVFNLPGDVAVDSSGNIWVADSGNNRVQEFSSSNTFIQAFGSSGSGNGQFATDEGIAVSPTNGNVYVTDLNNNRVEEFTPAGVFVTTFGTLGSGNGQLHEPRGIAIDSGGNVWVADYANSRIEEFSSSGSYMQKIGSEGSGNGQFKTTTGVTVCEGNVYATDYGNQRVEEFSTAGKYERTFGSSGTGNGQFTQISRIACDTVDHVLYVMDKGGNRVEIFGLTGSFLGAFGSSGAGPAQLSVPLGLAVGPNDHVYIADKNNNRIEEWAPPSLAYTNTFGSSGSGNGQFNTPSDVAVDASGNIWVADAANNRIEEFSSSRTFTRSVGSAGSGNGQLSNDLGIAISPANGNVYVADEGNKRIEEFTPTGSFVTAFGSLGSGNGQLNGPHGISIDSSGNVWVADFANNRIEEFSSSGAYLKQFGSAGSGNGQFRSVAGVSVCDGNVYAADYENQRVEEFSTSGVYESQFGWASGGNGQFTQISRIACDASGRVLYVSDKGSNRIEVFGLNGEFLGAFGSYGSGAAQLSTPIGIGVASSGHVYVADSANNRVTEWVPFGAWQQPAHPAAGAGTTSVETVEYHVPSSVGGPYPMDGATVAEWGQSDLPTDATAIFPPDEPVGWPAESYKRATIYYLDGDARTVNVASPSGAISTTEYNNANNDVERALSADNREAALKEGSKSAEVAEALSTKSSYSSDGTELQSTVGPEHTIQLANGTQIKARKHVRFFYDEGAPAEGGPYRLVTKSIEGAQLSNGENEQEPRTVTKSYSGQENLGWKLRAPTSTTTTAHGKELVAKTKYEASTGNVIETQTPGASAPTGIAYSAVFGSLGSGNGQLSAPKGIAVDAKGDVLVADELNNRVEVFNEKGEYVKAIGSVGSGSGQLKAPRGVAVDSRGDVWVVDTGNNRTDLFNEKGEFQATNGWGVNDGKAEFERCTGASCRVGIAGSGGGQFKEPTGVAIDSRNDAVVTDTGNSRTELFNENGEFEGANGWGVSNGEAKFETCTGSGCQAGIAGSGAGQFKEPTGVAIGAHNNELIVDTGNSRVEVYGENGGYERTFGVVGSGNGQFKAPKGIAVDSHSNVWVADTGNYRAQELSEKGEYVAQFGSKGAGNGQFQEPFGIQLNSHGEIFVGDVAQDRIQRFTQAPDQGNSEAHDTQTIYYTTAANGTYPACGKHPEWTGLACQAQHAAQPGVGGLPNLPVTTYTYNIWNEPLTTTDTVGATTRTSTDTYDGAGRLKTAAISASIDTPLPTVSYEYNAETGALSKQSTTTEGKTKSLTSAENTLGQITSYIDADGNIATYEYETEKDDRLTKFNDGKGTQTYSYNATTGEVSSLKDSVAGTFTATRDAEGNITTEGYPNGMNANYTLNAVGEPVNLEYVKTSHCTSGCTMYKDAVTPSIFAQWRTQTSTLSKQNYEYDEMGRLTQVQDTPAGKGCTTRLYAYDEDGNRTSLATSGPNSKGECSGEGSTSESHSYDTADRLIDPGVAYDAFGNTTALPAADVGGSALASTFYVNDTLASQEQNGEKISYNLDPGGRIRETVSSGTTNSTVISHYAGWEDSPNWTASGTNWTRYISGIGNGLAAIQTNSETPVLQLANLHGDIIATAALSETETKLLSEGDTTEYGVPRTSSPAKYSWLGSLQRPTELPTGVINMGARTYIPQLGRFEQTDPKPGGSINAYAYTFDDPVNSADPSGEFTNTVSYDESAASAGPAQAGLEEFYAGPGAISAPPVNMQIEEEFVAHLPWNAPAVQDAATGGGFGLDGGLINSSMFASAAGSRNKGGGIGEPGTSGGEECKSGGKKVKGKCQQTGQHPSHPSWCKAAYGILFLGGGLDTAVSVTIKAAAGVGIFITGAIVINECGL
jgi:RHS repeat-associated protein